jgi:nucleoid-associated protein YgaU
MPKSKSILRKLDFPESYISITLGFLVVIVAGLLAYNYFTQKSQPNQTSNTAYTDNSTVNTAATLKNEEIKQAVQASLPAKHKVGAGETLWTIAEKYYGSGYNWVTLARENKLTNPDQIIIGQELSVPTAQVIKPVTGQALSTKTAPERKYTVVKGDSLWKIAVAEYGDGFAWVRIATANHLVRPNLIHAGNVLTIPR